MQPPHTPLADTITRVCRKHDLPISIATVIVARYAAHRYETLHAYALNDTRTITVSPILSDVLVRLMILRERFEGRIQFLKMCGSRPKFSNIAQLIDEDERARKDHVRSICGDDEFLLPAVEALEANLASLEDDSDSGESDESVDVSGAAPLRSPTSRPRGPPLREDAGALERASVPDEEDKQSGSETAIPARGTLADRLPPTESSPAIDESRLVASMASLTMNAHRDSSASVPLPSPLLHSDDE